MGLQGGGVELVTSPAVATHSRRVSPYSAGLCFSAPGIPVCPTAAPVELSSAAALSLGERLLMPDNA